MKEIASILDWHDLILYWHDLWSNAEEVMERIGDAEMKEETEK